MGKIFINTYFLKFILIFVILQDLHKDGKGNRLLEVLGLNEKDLILPNNEVINEKPTGNATTN